MNTWKAKIPIEVSARHIHFSQDDFKRLFGYSEPTLLRTISQPNQFAANETVTVRGSKGTISKVRVVGPLRNQTQLEIAVGDCRKLGLQPHYATSGDLEKSGGDVVIEGPTDTLRLAQGVITPLPHLHLSPSEAENLNLAHLEKVTVRLKESREISLHGVVVRTRKNIDKAALHIDTDQANSIGDINKAKIVSIKKDEE